ncbi:MAG TPA: NUDIX hydrolase [Acidimicrobiales bacterium]|nr:NUDIX hydrolase [Acidimicrobiales bacterium]
MIEAAGGVLWRRTSGDRVKILVIHRPRYDDWSLPKGKLEAGESARSAALREVEEETGLRCKAGDELAARRYKDRKGRSKRVRYWAMQPLDGEFEPNDEVDEVRWVPLDDAAGVLTYGHDADVVAELGRRLLVEA